MNLNEMVPTLSQYMINTNENFSDRLNDAINMHNGSVASFAQSLTIGSLVSLLLKKEIITESEISEELRTMFKESEQLRVITYNREMLGELIDEEMTYLKNVKDMYENLENEQIPEQLQCVDMPSIENSDSDDQ